MTDLHKDEIRPVVEEILKDMGYTPKVEDDAYIDVYGLAKLLNHHEDNDKYLRAWAWRLRNRKKNPLPFHTQMGKEFKYSVKEVKEWMEK